MPDLIIKPTAGSGNKLILQDQGGGALLTSATSGATLADDVQDNITRLGTVVTGNITTPLASATFPAGSVIQTVTEVYNIGNSDTTTSGTQSIVEVGSDEKHWKCTINNVLANSKVLISCNFTFELAHAGIDPGCGFSFWRGTSTKIYPPDHEGQNTMYFVPRQSGSATLFYCVQTNLEWLDESPDTGSTTYYLGYAVGHTSVKIGSGTGSTESPFNMILQEIAG